jgi:hypothetical protein
MRFAKALLSIIRGFARKVKSKIKIFDVGESCPRICFALVAQNFYQVIAIQKL